MGWHTAFAGMMFDVQHNDKGWERVVRAPGVRIIFDDQNSGTILLTREFRHELDGYDYRLPGGVRCLIHVLTTKLLAPNILI